MTTEPNLKRARSIYGQEKASCVSVIQDDWSHITLETKQALKEATYYLSQFRGMGDLKIFKRLDSPSWNEYLRDEEVEAKANRIRTLEASLEEAREELRRYKASLEKPREIDIRDILPPNDPILLSTTPE